VRGSVLPTAPYVHSQVSGHGAAESAGWIADASQSNKANADVSVTRVARGRIPVMTSIP